MYTVEAVKAIGKLRTKDSLSELLRLFHEELPIEVKREIVSSIGRHDNNDRVYDFIMSECLRRSNPMELIYQMFRTCLYKGREDPRFSELGEKILAFYKNNEVLAKMKDYYEFRHDHVSKLIPASGIKSPLLLAGDAEEMIGFLPDNSVHLVFTSPTYYNAREYSDYSSYSEYLDKMRRVFASCCRVLEAGRFLAVNVSPVITKRPAREFESIRYPIHYDFHGVLVSSGYYFVDEIIWVKPEPSVPDRISGYKQTRKPLSYKPNCITESIMIYRKDCPFLLDRNMRNYASYDRHEEEDIDTSNCWYIAPKSDRNHPAVFPEELCRRILRYYSFEGDVVMDPFAGSGTLGRAARRMGRLPVMCEVNEEYVSLIESEGYYDVWRRDSKKDSQQITIW